MYTLSFIDLVSKLYSTIKQKERDAKENWKRLTKKIQQQRLSKNHDKLPETNKVTWDTLLKGVRIDKLFCSESERESSVILGYMSPSGAWEAESGFSTIN